MELKTVWDGNTKTPHRGLLCSPEAMHETKPAPAVNVPQPMVWGQNRHLWAPGAVPAQTKTGRHPNNTEKRQAFHQRLEVVRAHLKQHRGTVGEVKTALGLQDWNLRHCFKVFKRQGILRSAPTHVVLSSGRPMLTFWIEAP